MNSYLVDESRYGSVYYVDYVWGEDFNTGEFDAPLKHFDYALKNALDGDAIVLLRGEHRIDRKSTTSSSIYSCMYIDKSVDVFGDYNGGTVVTCPRTASFGGSYHSFLMFAVSNVRIYNIVFKFTGTYYAPIGIAYNTGTPILGCVIMNCIFDINVSRMFSSRDDCEVLIGNCSFVTSFSSTLQSAGNTLVVNSSFLGPPINNSYTVFQSCIYYTEYGDSYYIVSPEWQGLGSGVNRNGSAAHIGAYGGEYLMRLGYKHYIFEVAGKFYTRLGDSFVEIVPSVGMSTSDLLFLGHYKSLSDVNVNKLGVLDLSSEEFGGNFLYSTEVDFPVSKIREGWYL